MPSALSTPTKDPSKKYRKYGNLNRCYRRGKMKAYDTKNEGTSWNRRNCLCQIASEYLQKPYVQTGQQQVNMHRRMVSRELQEAQARRDQVP